VKLTRIHVSLVALVALSGLIAAPASATAAPQPAHYHIDCSTGAVTCTELADPEAFGQGVYVGHDEPSTLFYSDKPGSGNQNQWKLVLPKDPPPDVVAGRSWNFQLHPAFWFGMALCDTQSAPHPSAIHTCTPDSDKNITSNGNIGNHAGSAFMELQFYPPGWKLWPLGNSCDATRWCAAMNIFSLAKDYVTGQDLNADCVKTTGIEPGNFAFITKSGVPQDKPNPVESTLATFTPQTANDLMMRSGDTIQTTMHDTGHGLRVDLKDATTGQNGSMVASADNGFGQVKFAPAPSTDCVNIPYDFHPMYSTSSEKTRVPWAAHSYNIAFADEIGHFDYCSSTLGGGHSCSTAAGTTEGVAKDREATDADDTACFTAAESTLVPVTGCQGTNSGFDGVPYQRLWPDGNPNHPTTIQFSSPLTGKDYSRNYQRAAFEADLPRVEAADVSTAGLCNRDTGQGCTLIPVTDDQLESGKFKPANFYPWFTAAQSEQGCMWTFGANIPGLTTQDFGKNQQYGELLRLVYPKVGGTLSRFNDFRNVLDENPCPASGMNQEQSGDHQGN
jgi:hypothetical protein